jgi:hypothetical protein
MLVEELMNAAQVRTWGLAVCLACLTTPGTWAADLPRGVELPIDPLEEVFERIRGHAAGDAWQKEGWKDERIEAWLEKLVSTIASGADLPELKLPVRLADVRPPANPRQPAFDGVLVVGKVPQPQVLRNSIVLSDGDIDLMSVENCVIASRGTVSVLMARSSVIVAGTRVVIDLDGSPGDTTKRNLVVTRGWADLASGYGTVVVAPGGLHVARPQDMVFINAEVPAGRDPFGGANPSRSVRIDNLPLEPLPAHPLSTTIDVLGIVQGEAIKPGPALRPVRRRTSQAQSVVFRFDGRRYVADLEEVIVDEAGEPVEALRGWKLQHANSSIAIFAKGDTLAMVRTAAR